MNPIDISLEEPSQTAREPVTPAPAGTPSCHVIVPPEGKVCGASATRRIVWPDGDVTPACVECAVRLSALAQSLKETISVK